MDWKDRLKGLMLEYDATVKNRPTHTTPPEPSEEQQKQIAKANYEKWRRGQRRVGQKHIDHYRRQLQRDDY